MQGRTQRGGGFGGLSPPPQIWTLAIFNPIKNFDIFHYIKLLKNCLKPTSKYQAPFKQKSCVCPWYVHSFRREVLVLEKHPLVLILADVGKISLLLRNSKASWLDEIVRCSLQLLNSPFTQASSSSSCVSRAIFTMPLSATRVCEYRTVLYRKCWKERDRTRNIGPATLNSPPSAEDDICLINKREEKRRLHSFPFSLSFWGGGWRNSISGVRGGGRKGGGGGRKRRGGGGRQLE